MVWCCSILPCSAAGMGNTPRFLHLLGEIMAGTDLWQDPVMDLWIPWEVLWAQQEGREGPAALSCSDYSGSSSMVPVPGSEPGRAGGTAAVAGLCGHIINM